MLTIESRMIIIFWPCSPISLKHVSYWYHVLKATPKPHHSNRDDHLREITKLGIMKCSHLKGTPQFSHHNNEIYDYDDFYFIIFCLLILWWTDYSYVYVFWIVPMSSFDGSTHLLIHDISQEPINLHDFMTQLRKCFITLACVLANSPSLSSLTWCLRTS